MRYLGYHTALLLRFTRLSRSMARFSKRFKRLIQFGLYGPATPAGQVPLVWAIPLSLATTRGITSFSFPEVTEMFHFTSCRSDGL